MLIVGIIKYGERVCSLYCGSIKYFRDSFLDLSSDYFERRDERELQNYFFSGIDDRARKCFGAIRIFVSLFVDMVLSPGDIIKDREEFQIIGDNGYMILDHELKSMYDIFYTKAFPNYGVRGLISRFISLTTTAGVFVFYAMLSEKREYLDVDHIITYLLLIGALLAEIYAFMKVVSSKWTRTSLLLNHRVRRCVIFVVTRSCHCCMRCVKLLYVLVRHIKKDVVHSKLVQHLFLGQSNFLNMISNKRLNRKGNFFLVNELEELTSVGECCLSSNLVQVICERLRDKSKEDTRSNPSSSLGYRNLLLGKNVQIFASELELHRTIITWHIATDLFYYYDEDSNSKLNERKNCKVMSDYMFYLLVKQRQMLPVGAGLITLKDTIIEAKNIIAVPQDNLAQVSRTLLQHDTTRTRDEVSKMPNTYVLFRACAVANQLIVEENRQQAWKFVEELWIKIMSYASAQCRVDMHAHQLRKGPEFLSHFWLFQAHLGLLDQFQITPRQESVDIFSDSSIGSHYIQVTLIPSDNAPFEFNQLFECSHNTPQPHVEHPPSPPEQASTFEPQLDSSAHQMPPFNTQDGKDRVIEDLFNALHYSFCR
ncbi:hypothetical protein Fmac_028982 [Flemingia macrophylla]|uniref:DUF4220 domain-containing protein n=1 Tax=Flemingia macrophylla TaxID=520843 RepID=A0ABD1L9J0_9FABA